MSENELSKLVIGKAIDMHKKLGPGLLESAYRECLFYMIQEVGLKVEKEKYLPLVFENRHIKKAYRIDLLVEKKLVIELKCVECIHSVHMAQTLTYLKLGNYKLGLNHQF